MPKVFTVPYHEGREPTYEEPREYYSHCVGKGWHDLLCDLSEKLFHLGWDGGLEQVKEKFGTLRFYWRNNIEGLNAEIAEDIVAYAENKSGWLCETCGGHGKRRGDGWIHTSCDKCWEQYLANKKERAKDE